MSVSFNISGPRGHVSARTGRPTGRVHVKHKHHRPAVVVHKHISRHSGRPTGRVHIFRSRVQSYTTPVKVSGAGAGLTIGIAAIIAGLAMLILGGLFLNPVIIGFGAVATVVGGLAIAGSVSFLCMRKKA